MTQVRQLASEALRTKIIGHARSSDFIDPPLEQRGIAFEFAQQNLEGISGQRTPRQLAVVHMCLDDLITLALHADPISRCTGLARAAARRNGEPLGRHRMPIFETGVTHIEIANPDPARELARDPTRIRIAFAHTEQEMRTLPGRFESEIFDDLEILGLQTDARTTRNGLDRARRRERKAFDGRHARSIRTTASAASPSRRPR